MKRVLSGFMAATLLFLCCACSDKEVASSSMADVATASPLPSSAPTATSPSTPSPSPIPVLPTLAPPDSSPSAEKAETQNGVDVDLTVLSSTMVYAEVYNMLMNPDDYIGKRVRIRGQFTAHQDTTTGAVSCGVIVKDATACCAEGFDLIVPEGWVYPNDYPAQDEEITVTGILQADRTLEDVGIVFLQLSQIVFE